jgi:hypothetical protein
VRCFRDPSTAHHRFRLIVASLALSLEGSLRRLMSVWLSALAGAGRYAKRHASQWRLMLAPKTLQSPCSSLRWAPLRTDFGIL